jgi:hypothetical protein
MRLADSSQAYLYSRLRSMKMFKFNSMTNNFCWIAMLGSISVQNGFSDEPKFYRSLGQVRVSSYQDSKKVAGRYMTCEDLRGEEGFDSKIAPYYINANQYIFINDEAAKALFYSLARNPEAVKKWDNPDIKFGYHNLSLKVTQDYVGLHNICCMKQREKVDPIFGESYYEDKQFICHIFTTVPAESLKESHKDLD